MINLLKQNARGIILMIFSSIFVCIGQLYWKFGAESQSVLELIIGCVLYGVGALIMIIAYRYGHLSVLQPILSITYVASLFIGYYILNEKIYIINILGVLAVIIGILFIIAGDKNNV